MSDEPEILTVEQVAQKLKVSKRRFSDIISKQPDFPSPLPYNKRNRTWLAESINSYLRNYA